MSHEGKGDALSSQSPSSYQFTLCEPGRLEAVRCHSLHALTTEYDVTVSDGEQCECLVAFTGPDDRLNWYPAEVVKKGDRLYFDYEDGVSAEAALTFNNGQTVMLLLDSGDYEHDPESLGGVVFLDAHTEPTIFSSVQVGSYVATSGHALTFEPSGQMEIIDLMSTHFIFISEDDVDGSIASTDSEGGMSEGVRPEAKTKPRNGRRVIHDTTSDEEDNQVEAPEEQEYLDEYVEEEESDDDEEGEERQEDDGHGGATAGAEEDARDRDAGNAHAAGAPRAAPFQPPNRHRASGSGVGSSNVHIPGCYYEVARDVSYLPRTEVLVTCRFQRVHDSGYTASAGDIVLVEEVHGERSLLSCRLYTGKQFTQLCVLIPVDAVLLVPVTKPSRAASLAPKFPTASEEPLTIPAHRLNALAPHCLVVTLDLTGVRDELSEPEQQQINRALVRGWWCHDELPLLKLHLQLQVTRGTLTNLDYLKLCSFEIDLELIRKAQQAEQELKAKQLAKVKEYHPTWSQTDQAKSAASAREVEVIDSSGSIQTFLFPEHAAMELGVHKLAVTNAREQQHALQLPSGQIVAVRYKPPVWMPGEQVVSTLSGKVTTAGRLDAHGSGLKFGVLSSKEEGGSITKRYLHANMQTARHILLLVAPWPNDVNASHYEADHIETNALDNRLCALQWIKGHLSNDSQHATKSEFERRPSGPRP